MNEISKRIELIALAQENSFKLGLVKDKYEVLLKLVNDAKKHNLNLWMFRECEEIQKELLNNEQFFSIVAECKRHHHFSPEGLEKLLLSITCKDDNISNYSPEQIFETIDISKYFETHKNGLELRYAYLKYFSGRGIGERKKKRLVNSLIKLSNHIEELDNCFVKEKCSDVLSSMYYSEASLVVTDAETLDVLVDNENARKFLVFYYSKEYIYNDLNAKELKWISDNFSALIPDLKKIYSSIGYSNFKTFFSFWRENDLSLNEVKLLIKQLETMGYVPEAFASKVNYVNYICGNKLKDFDLEYLCYGQSEMLIYAILNNKKGFLKLIKENFNAFYNITADSVFFDEYVYRNILNLNALNLKNLQELVKMKLKDFNSENFENRNYTFDEFKALYNEDEQYGKVYHLLKIHRVDDRLVVLRELCKRHLLPPDLSEEKYELIAEKLSEKPLSRWYKENYSDISGLALGDVVYILADFYLIERFRAEIKSRKDVFCIIRNRQYATISKSFKDMVNKILKNDTAWLELKEAMYLSEEFVKDNKKTIAEFVFNGNASIANEYYPCLKEKYKTAFFTVVKADMLGKLKELKYFSGDLAKEIDYPVTESQELIWSENMDSGSMNISVKECDGFEETMMMGVKPTHTCMDYSNGQYRECLISNFDSNKKILYAYINGTCVARAILRLTKGSYKEGESRFADGELKFAEIKENGNLETSSGNSKDEHITVFLEKMYSAGINTATIYEVQTLFVDHAMKKAEMLDAECVISTNYCKGVEEMPYTSYRMYISRSKAGNQYLDSLGGSASVSSERQMKNTTVFTARRKENGQV